MDHLHQESKICIGPTTGEFTPGIQIEGHGRYGSEYDKEVDHMSDECKKAAVVFGLKLTITDEKVGQAAVDTLKQLKDMAMGIPPVQEALEKLNVDFRAEGNAVFINVIVPETLPELAMIPGWDKVNLAGTQYGGKADWKVTTGLDPTKFLNATVDDIIDRLSHFSVEGQANFEELHHVLSAVSKIAQDFLPPEKEFKIALSALNLLAAFRSFNLEFKYDPETIKSVLKSILESSGKLEKVNGKLGSGQELVNGFLPQAQMMAPMFIEPYADLLKNINLGHYEVFVMVPRLRFYIRPGFTLFGLNSFVNEKFLSA